MLCPIKPWLLEEKNEQGGKFSKERDTILNCAKLAGEKEPLLVIEKSSRPRTFKKLEMDGLPVAWKSNKKV